MSSLKHYFYFIIIYLSLICISLSNSGGPSGNVANNAPSYNNCTQCHYGSVNSGGGSASVLGLPSGGYIPGESYTLTVSVSGSNERGYGFQMASQVGNDNAGTFSLGSASENAELNGNRVQHSTRTVSGEWIIEWLAPSSDVGDITFSVSGLATGGTSGNGGDDIYTSAVTLPASTPQTTNLFFSEYAEGNSNNKYLEIYNPTESTIDLSGFAFASAANAVDVPGQYEYWNEFDSGSQIAPGDVFVIAHPSADGTILAQADMTHTYLSNGNDGYCIVEGTESDYTIIDCVGDWLGDPGSSGWDVAGVSGATVNHTLVRKATVTEGNPDWVASSGTDANNSEWIVFDNETWDYLGFHTYGTGGENMSPVASAGTNQTVEFESLVTLDGSSSVDPDGTIEDFLWTQTAGSTVALSSTNQPEVTFTAPAVVDSLSFTLTVTDNEGASSSSTVYVKTAQGVSNQIFFSEYAEGSSNNKYLEIYNGSGSDIDLSQYVIASCSNGCGDNTSWDYPENITFEGGTVVSAGDVYVIAHPSADAAILAQADYTGFLYLSNGDDAFGIVNASTGQIIDIIGDRGPDPGDGWDVAGVTAATKDHTLVRKGSVEQGNSDWASSSGTDAASSEWIVYDQNTWDYLGVHTQSVDAPIVSFNSVSPAFITSSTEIEFTALVTTPVGSITSAVVKYGTNGQLLNESELYLEGGDTWAGNIPAQDGNIVLQMQVVATNSEGTSGQSVIQERMIANSTPTSISDLYTNQTADQIVTIKGIVTIGGSGLLHPSFTKAYVQDESGRGLQLFDYDQITDLERGSEVEVVGYAGYYFTTYQMTDFEYRVLSTNNTLPEAVAISAAEANSANYEGTLVSISGSITDTTLVNQTDGINLTIDDVTNVMIWSTTEVNVSNLIPGFSGSFTGVGSQFGDQYQLLVAYDSDILSTVAIDNDEIIVNDFSLLSAYPNPFNPKTSIRFSMGSQSLVSLEIYDINGKLVKSFSPKVYMAGLNQLEWDASGASSGMYFIHLVNGSKRLTQKVMLLK